MRLRWRFTLTLGIAALVPISVAAVITRQVIAGRERDQYDELRRSARASAERELEDLKKQVVKATESLAKPDHALVAGLTLMNVTQAVTGENLRPFRQQSKNVMDGLSLDLLIITAPDDDDTLVSPHYRDGGSKPNPQIRERVEAARGEAYFVLDKIRTGAEVNPTLIAQAARFT